MHGRFRSEGEGSCRSLQRSISWHMQPTVIPADSNSFLKDGRKIGIGDCALFKPSQDAPPSVGLIRQLTPNKDNNLQLAVNWLYRPAELKLGKGSLLESAPNEIFYSFLKDEITAASLLHPCKVAFLPRGAELPTGTSAFVCRRVYDIENKCLWWLTDQDYTDERQEEVGQLLHKTRIEMHGTMQPGGHSPEQANSLTSATQLKHGSENAQNSGTSFSSQTKGKKRERGDHSTDPVKRERSSRADESCFGLHKTGNTVKSDLGNMTEKGGLADIEGVEKLVQVMQQQKLSFFKRSVVARIVAATDKIECLNRFMQLKGLSVFDEWIQVAQKAKFDDGEKSVEDCLFVLLRALDKLPVDLPALQTCNIGRSVNHLRAHKNVDIQRKARNLVDIWKKRVQAQMIIIDAEMKDRGGPVWSSKLRYLESSHAGSRTQSGSGVAIKSSIAQHSASKTTSVKSSHGENNTKSTSSSPDPVKPSSPPISVKESQHENSVCGSGIPDAPLSREDRSSSSSQSHSYSPSISTKEEAKSSTAVSAAASKSNSRNKKGGCFPKVIGAQKESALAEVFQARKSSSKIESSTPDKVCPTPDKVCQSCIVSEADNTQIIVSNRSWSPSRFRKSRENRSAVSQTSISVLSDKLDAVNKNSGEKSETLQCNASSGMKVDSCQVNYWKDIPTGSGDGAGSVAFHLDEEKSTSTEDSRLSKEGPKKNQSEVGKFQETPFGPMNALIESLTTAVSAAVSKLAISSSRNRKGGEFPGVCGSEKESGSSKSFSTLGSSPDKAASSGIASDRVLEAENEIIVPNRSWSPSGFRKYRENCSAVSSQRSVQMVLDKLDAADKSSGEKNEILQYNASPDLKMDSCQVNNRKDIFIVTADGRPGTVSMFLDEEKSMSTEDRLSKKGSKKKQLKAAKFQETSFSPMNASIQSSTAVPAAASSRNRKGGGFPRNSGAQKESGSSKSFSAMGSSTPDKLSPPGIVSDADNSQIIAPNRSWSPSRFRKSRENRSALNSQSSLPVLSDKIYAVNKNSEEKSETLQCNASSDMKVDSCQVNDGKDILMESGDGSGSAAVLDEEKSMSTEDSRLPKEGPKKNQSKVGKFQETSFGPMNALIESCVKYSEAHSSMSPEDDVGMNLLASVATGEMSRSELISPTDSSNDAKSKSSPEDQIRLTEGNDGEGGDKKLALLNGSWAEDGLHVPKQLSFSSDINCRPCSTSAELAAGETKKSSDTANSRSKADPECEVNKNLTQKTDADKKIGDGEIHKEVKEDKAPSSIVCVHDSVNCENEGTNVSGTEGKSGDDPLGTAKGILMVEAASPNQSCNIDCKSHVNDGLMVETGSMKKITAVAEQSELIDISSSEKSPHSPQHILSEIGHAVKVREMEEKGINDRASEVENDRVNITVDIIGPIEGRKFAGLCSTIDRLKSHNTDGHAEKKESGDQILPPEAAYPASVTRGGYNRVDEVESASDVAELTSAALVGPNPDAKVRIDLNEGFTVDDAKYGEPTSLVASVSTSFQMSNRLQFSLNPIPTVHPASITVAAAAKGPFVPPEDLLKSKGELGWKGSAATSAFRPAEPRKVIELPLASTKFSSDASTIKNGRLMLDIDLNIDLNEPDEMSSGDSTLVNKSSGCMPVLGSGGLDLDLNRVDESNDTEQCSTSRSHNEEGSVGHAKSSDVQRGFDLNDRPGFDDGSAEQLTVIQQVKAATTSLPPLTGPRSNNPSLGSLSSWFPPPNTYSTMAIPSAISDRADQPYPVIPPGAAQRMFGHAGISPFAHDVYRGSVLSSSPAISFPSSPFQIPMYPYGHSFPLSSASFPIGGASYADSSSGTRIFAPPVNSQLLGPVGAVSSHFQRPFMVGLPDNSSSSGLENGRKWLRQGLDLNSVDGDFREENLPHLSSQHFVANSQVGGEEQARLYPVSGNVLKRNEPDGGWDKESLRYKQSPWK